MYAQYVCVWHSLTTFVGSEGSELCILVGPDVFSGAKMLFAAKDLVLRLELELGLCQW